MSGSSRLRIRSLLSRVGTCSERGTAARAQPQTEGGTAAAVALPSSLRALCAAGFFARAARAPSTTPDYLLGRVAPLAAARARAYSRRYRSIYPR